MSRFTWPGAACRVALLLTLPGGRAAAQVPAPTPASRDTVVAAGSRYVAGHFHEWLLGRGYRDLWAYRQAIPVLDLKTFAGGLHPLKAGGGLQTKSLRFATADGAEYAFRSIDKWVHLPARLKGTLIEGIFRDEVSATFPGGGVVVAPLLEAGGVLHATPIVVFLPDDVLLGEFRKEFAGRVGTLEAYPSKPEHGNGFSGALEIIDSDSLLILLNHDPAESVDTRALLTARLLDLFVNDPDRHPGQWKWARMTAGAKAAWQPIPRDRDQAFIDYGGVLMGVARKARPNLVAFTGTPNVSGLTYNSLEMDRRLLVGLEKPVWDSVVVQLMGRLSDPVIDSAVGMMAAGYRAQLPGFGATLKARRDGFAATADQFYRLVAGVADIHGTDGAEQATITRMEDGKVEVRITPRGGAPSFDRRFDLRETSEIRLYLHGGDDSALVTGHAHRSIPIWIIGGNGANVLADSSRVDRRDDRARRYDDGQVSGVSYGPDTLFNRRPWVRDGGRMVPAFQDRGRRTGAIANVGGDRGLGAIPRLGIVSYQYGFGRRPYERRVEVAAEYSVKVGRIRAEVNADQRWEQTPFHLAARARMSGFDVVNYHGLGNATLDSPATDFSVRQQQWLFQPALALALTTTSDLTLGPSLQYTNTDGAASPFLTSLSPYGAGHFGEAGVRLGLHHEASDRPHDPNRRVKIDLAGTYYPAVWNVTSSFGRVSAMLGAQVRMPIPAHPVLVVQGGAVKLFGEFPFFEAAFLGANSTVRPLDAQRYAGDASLYGSAELRIPVIGFSFLVPLDVGVLGLADAGRVYLKGLSPGGWHNAAGGGVWFGIADTRTIMTLTFTTEQGRSGLQIHSGLYF